MENMHSICNRFLFVFVFWTACSVKSSLESNFWSSSSRIGNAVRKTMAGHLPPLFRYTQSQDDASSFIQDGNATMTNDWDRGALVSIDSMDDGEDIQLVNYMGMEFFKEKTTIWGFLSSAFRMSMEAKNELNSSFERTQSLLTSTGGGGAQWKSSTTAFIASKATATLERVGKRLIDELAKETTTNDSTHEVVDNLASTTPKDSATSTSKIKNEGSTKQMDGSKVNNSISIQGSGRYNQSYQIQSDEKEQWGSSILHHNQSSIQTQALDHSNMGVFVVNTTLAAMDRGPRGLRAFRKRAARTTGVHGFFSRKKSGLVPNIIRDQDLDENDLSIIRRRIAAIQIARERVADKVAVAEKRFEKKLKGSEPSVIPFRRIFGLQRQSLAYQNGTSGSSVLRSQTLDDGLLMQSSTDELGQSDPFSGDLERVSLSAEDLQRAEKLKEIDQLILEGQKRLLQLQCQKDILQQHLNPLFNYSSTEWKSGIRDFNNATAATSRIFNFPSPQLVTEYIQELMDTRRLMKLNHTHLWRYESDEDDVDDIGDDLLTPSANAQKLYNQPSDCNEEMIPKQRMKDRRNPNGSPMGGGSWLLRQSIGKGGSFGEKLGETVETAAYRGICSAVMSFLTRLLAQLHGLNVLMHSDVRLFMQNSPDLPPVSRKQVFDAENYAQETLRRVIRKNSKKRKAHHRTHRSTAEDNFMQRNAVVETLLSHCQISAPLLKLFPLAWQRAMLGNCVTLTLAIISDFCDNIQFPILGHILSLSLQPITEDDILHQIGTNRLFFNHRFAKPVEFEAAVRATAIDISENFKFLDRWHERALGSDLLRAQLGNLIARLVLTLVDEILCGARIDLWTSQAGGPRLLLGLQYK